MKRTLRLFCILFVAAYAAWPNVGQAYVWGGYKWQSRAVPYYVNPANADVSQAAALAAIQEGAATWTQQSNADFAFYYMGGTSGSSFVNNGKNEVFFRNTTNGGLVAETMRWFDGAGNLLDADIAFYDAGWQFFTGTSGCAGGVYVEDFAAHEFGHALGLKHSTVASATMYAMGTNCSTSWRVLDADDLAGVESIYPSSGANSAPSVNITAPSTGASVVQGTGMTFTGSATDREDGTISARLTWTSNIDGQLGTGSTFTRTLSAGTHTVKALVVDSAGASASAQVAVTVTGAANAAPSVSIGSPANNASVVQGSAFSFSGAASDTEDGNLSAGLTWTSNLDGQLGVGSTVSRVLSVGTHTVTAVVTDSAGATGSRSVAVTVTVYVNAPPAVSITYPSNNASFGDGTSVTFAGSATDREDGNLSARLVWKSSIDGPLGLGAGFTHALSTGTHTISAEVTDSSGSITMQTALVTVRPVVPGSGVTLNAVGSKVKGNQRVDLSWTGATSATVDIFRNGALLMTAPNSGSQVDSINRKGGGISYVYKVCESGTSICSNSMTVAF